MNININHKKYNIYNIYNIYKNINQSISFISNIFKHFTARSELGDVRIFTENTDFPISLIFFEA